MGMKFKRTKKSNLYRLLVCDGDCDSCSFRIVVDDDGMISVECEVCGESSMLSDMVNAPRDE